MNSAVFVMIGGIDLKVVLDGKSLTIEKVVDVARNFAKVEISASAKKGINKCRKFIEKQVELEKPMYGITTGIGEFANVPISKEDG